MDRFDPFVKYADVYGDIINWEKDPMNKPQNQNKYFFSDGKTYYEQICKMLRLMSVFKKAFNQIYSNEDEISEAWENFVNNLSASVVEGSEPDVTLTWTDDSVNFEFTMVPGVPGEQGVGITSISFNSDYTMTITLSDGNTYTSMSLKGETGPQGPQGETGSGLQILDVYATLADLQSAHPTGQPGDAYQVGSGGNYTLYIWSSSQSAWVHAGSLGTVSPSTSDPLMNGTASAASSNLYSRGDHVHPTDTSRASASDLNNLSDTISGIISDMLTKTEASSLYQTILGMSNYLLKQDAPGYADILTETEASALYQTITAMSNYLLKTDAPGYADILTETEASALYQTITAMSNYLLKTDAPGYTDILTQTDASSIYQTILGMSNYLLKQDAPGYNDILTETEAQAIYQTIANMSNYVTNNTIASALQLGLVKVGNGLSIDANGVLSASGSGIVLGNPISLTPTVNKGSIISSNLILRKSSDGRYFCLNGYIIVKGVGATSLDNAVTMSLNESVKAVTSQKKEYGFATTQNINSDMIMSGTFISIETSGALEFHYLCTTNNTSFWFNGSVIDVDSL